MQTDTEHKIEDIQEKLLEIELEEEEAVTEDLGETTRQTIFYLEPEWYGIDTEYAQEVIKVPPITYVPYTPGFIHGLINLRGNIVVAADIRELFGLGRIKLQKDSRVLVVKVADKTTGIMVDNISDVLDIPVKNIQPPVSTIRGVNTEFIKGETKLPDGRFLALLDLNKLMASEQIKAISEKKGS